MKNIFFHLILFSGLLTLLFSCERDNEGTSGVDTLAITIENRAVNATWATGDAIGLTIYNTDYTEIVDNQFNREYVCSSDGTTFTGSSANNIAYFPQNGSSIRINAYYPYRSDLGSDMLYPVSVADQSLLQNIDLMTAEHLTGFSKDDTDVHIHFYHRLSKLIFNLSTEEDGEYVSLADCTLTIEGTQTGNSYNLYSDVFTGPETGIANIQVPLRSNEADNYREAIVLPRAAAEGVRFIFTASNGDYYTAIMADTLSFEGGNQYTFNITLSRNPIVVGATIEPWVENGSYYYDILPVSTPAMESEGVTIGDVMSVYLQNSDNDQFTFLRDYTYTAVNTWTASTPVYWEDIEQNPAVLRASIIAEEALNTTQLPDILLAGEISVVRNTGANFTFTHAGAKVIVSLTSDTFSATDLENATITLPQYLTGGYEELGTLVEGTTRTDILVDRTDPAAGTAIFQPQAVAASDKLLTVTINGREYDAYDPNGFTFNAGTAYYLQVTVHKNELTLSATVVDWLTDSLDLEAVTVGAAVYGGENIVDGEELLVYTGDATTRTALTSFTYSATDNLFVPEAKVYWESLADPTTFYGYIKRADRYNSTQLDDFLVATPVTVSASNGVAFTLSHAAAKVVVELKSTDKTFSSAELAAMDITLPGYITGGSMDTGLFVPGSTAADVTVAKGVGDDNNSAIALIQPQTIFAGATVVRLNSTTRTYNATSTSPVLFEAGISTLITVDLGKTAVTLSARALEWEEGEAVNLVAGAIEVGGTLNSSDSFFTGKTIYINVWENNAITFTVPYSYDGTTWSGTPIYWDSYSGGINMTAVYSTTGQPTLSGTTFLWQIGANQNSSANDYYENYDLLVARLTLGSPWVANFQFTHAASKATVKLVAGTGFTDSDLVGSTVQLNDYYLDGTMQLTTAAFANITTVADVTPKTVTDGAEYSALVMPQTKAQGSTILTVTLPAYPTSPFAVTWDQATALSFEAGKETEITVTLNKTAIELSSRVIEWGEGDTGNVTIE